MNNEVFVEDVPRILYKVKFVTLFSLFREVLSTFYLQDAGCVKMRKT